MQKRVEEVRVGDEIAVPIRMARARVVHISTGPEGRTVLSYQLMDTEPPWPSISTMFIPEAVLVIKEAPHD